MPTIYSNLEYRDMLKVFYESGGKSTVKASRLYLQKFPERKQPSKNTFCNIETKLRNTGRFPNGFKPKKIYVIDEEHTVNVLAAFSSDPHASVRSVAKEMDISRSSIHRILKKNDFHPYKLHYVQGLKPSDPDRRLQYISKIICLHDHNNILKKILWTDESCFNNNGIVNRHNSHYWNESNPFWTCESNAQVRWSTNVWCGIISGYLIGPYFYHGTLTGQRYLDFLTNTLLMLLENIPLNLRVNMWIQQDGAPPHNSNIVRDYLNTNFQSRWIGTRGPLNWPPRSPDLTPLNFFLWGYLKDKVYSQQSTSLDDLKQRIIDVCNSLTFEMLESTTTGILERYEKCIMKHGAHFENYS